MKFYLTLLLATTTLALGQTKPKPLNNFRVPNQVTPLDEQTERLLKSSSLASEVRESDSSRKEFHEKAHKAYKKIKTKINLKSHDSQDFIYDCLFMIDEGLYLKYSDIPKRDLDAAREIVQGTFE